MPNPKTCIHINGDPITTTDSFKFLGTHISYNLTQNISLQKLNNNLTSLGSLEKIKNQLFVLFCSAITVSMITPSKWHGSTDRQTWRKLQWIVNKASKIIRNPLPSVESSDCETPNPSLPAHHLFQPLSSRRR